jgi:hypothetical protein
MGTRQHIMVTTDRIKRRVTGALGISATTGTSAKGETSVITRRYAYIANNRDVSKSKGPPSSPGGMLTLLTTEMSAKAKAPYHHQEVRLHC